MKKFASKNIRLIMALVIGVLVFAPAFIQKPLIIKLVSILNLNQIALTQGQAQGIERLLL